MRICLLVFLISSLAWADDDIKHTLSIAGGIANPSDSLAISQNPAGLIYPKATKAHLSVEQGADNGPVGLGGGILMGSDKVGGGAYLLDYNTDPRSVSRLYLFDAGLGVDYDPMNIAIGIGAAKTLGRLDPMDDTNSCQNWCIDIGGIYNPNGDFRIAGTITQLSDSDYLLGAGIAKDLSSEITVVVDAQTDSEKSTAVIKPGLGIFIQGFQLTGSYGVRAWGTQDAGLRQGWSGGIASNYFTNIVLQFYTNQFTQYYFGATLTL